MDTGDFDFLPLQVTHVGKNGKRSYDRNGKRRLIAACLEPNVSVASMAMRAQVNANQLWRWIRQHRAEEAGHISTDVGTKTAMPAAFVAVVEGRDDFRSSHPLQPPVRESVPACTQQPSTPLARLSARLPNGVSVELECAAHDAALVTAMVDALSRCHVST
ncbi:hypothetical protein RN01_07310 [Cupriavidus sp. SHE]|jgi:transposase|uniref:IS66 family insertion sequence element accessory protein TnpB n=1 Tax=Cupriavidus metallidurans TaxID=119219 RepID=A0A482ILG1_9BURK|nr:MULTISPECIES: transposase [Cupriavidus]KWR84305.1 hypothetical protein RN01_07310 [Cupriavidus sp. SHE]QBP09945.1 IS66 family insertion sequence element accessory protein TnpB [Cupriavidus metallidurans]